jgi:hypothetical protein
MIAAGTVVAAVAAGGVAGALLGIPGLSGAATTSTTAPKSSEAPEAPGIREHFGPFMGAGPDVLDAGAKALKLSTAALLSKLSDGKTTIADVAKQQNVDVQQVIDAMAAVAKTDITKMVNNPLPAGPSFEHGPGGLGFGFGFRGGARSDSLGAAAKALGITTKELLTDLGNGQSIADVAKAKHIDVNTVIDTLVSDAKSKVDAAVKAGDLTQDQATKIETDLKAHITDLVNNAHPKGGGRFGHWRFGPDGPGPAAPGFGGGAPIPNANA